MSNQTIKITYKSQEIQKHFYVMNNDSWMQLLQSIEANLKDVEINKLRKFWIDSDADEIEIDNEASFKMFNLQNTQNKKIYLQMPQVESYAPKNHHIHFGVTCDNCESGPIIGFRYKCLECEDFDLCATCEGKMAHAEHAMIRIAGDIKNLASKGHGHHKRRHHSHHGKRQARCPAFGGILSTIDDLNLQAAMKNSQQETSSSSSREGSPKKADCNTKKYEEHMKTSMDMLSNFHKMFSKILDPLGSDIVLEVRREDNPAKDSEKEPAKSMESSDKTENERIEKQPLLQEADKMDEAAGSSTSFQEESNWEVIHKEKSSSPEIVQPEMRAVLVPEKVSPPSLYPEMRAVLVTDCGSKMDVDDKIDDGKQQASAPEKPQESKKIYHTNPRINDAVIAMMAMGFSNDGAWLTQLLESVNGDIAQALDLMRPVK